eukprot:tig00021352_g20675.t1
MKLTERDSSAYLANVNPSPSPQPSTSFVGGVSAVFPAGSLHSLKHTGGQPTIRRADGPTPVSEREAIRVREVVRQKTRIARAREVATRPSPRAVPGRRAFFGSSLGNGSLLHASLVQLTAKTGRQRLRLNPGSVGGQTGRTFWLRASASSVADPPSEAEDIATESEEEPADEDSVETLETSTAAAPAGPTSEVLRARGFSNLFECVGPAVERGEPAWDLKLRRTYDLPLTSQDIVLFGRVVRVWKLFVTVSPLISLVIPPPIIFAICAAIFAAYDYRRPNGVAAAARRFAEKPPNPRAIVVGAYTRAVDGVINACRSVRRGVQETADNARQSVVRGVNNATGAVARAAEHTTGSIARTFDNATGAVRTSVTNTGRSIHSGVTGAVGAVARTVDGTVGAAGRGVVSVVGKVLPVGRAAATVSAVAAALVSDPGPIPVAISANKTRSIAAPPSAISLRPERRQRRRPLAQRDSGAPAASFSLPSRSASPVSRRPRRAAAPAAASRAATPRSRPGPAASPISLSPPTSSARFAAMEGLQVHYKMATALRAAEAAPAPDSGAVYIHGFGGSSFTWRHVLEPTSVVVGAAIAFDRPAFGLTSRPKTRTPTPGSGPYADAFAARLAAQFIDRAKLRRTVLVAHASAAPIAIEAYLKRPDRMTAGPSPISAALSFGKRLASRAAASAAIAASGAETVRAMREDPMGFLSQAFAAPEAIGQDTVEGYTRAMTLPEWEAGMLASVAANAGGPLAQDVAMRLADIEIPVLILNGESDAVASKGTTSKLRRVLPNCTVKTLRGCGHLPQEEQPVAFVRAVAEFIATINADE